MEVKSLENRIKKLNVLFVCGANKGRSIAAHIYAEQQFKKNGLSQLMNFDSGGIKDTKFYETMIQKGEYGAPIEIRNIMNSFGYKNVNNQISKPVTDAMIEKADIVLAFDKKVRDYLINKLESSSDMSKIQTIYGYVNGTEWYEWENNDIDDAQKFEGRYKKSCPFFREDGKVDMVKIWRDTRYTESKPAIYRVFSEMIDISCSLARNATLKLISHSASKRNILE